MAKITSSLTSSSLALRARPSPGRRLLALVLCAALSVSAVLPGFAAAIEADSEGEGTALPVDAPAPDFDPGGEDTPLEEAPAADDGEETEAVETEAQSEVTSVPAEAVLEEQAPQATPEVPEIAAAEVEPEPVPQQDAATEMPSEPVENQHLQAPQPAPGERVDAEAQGHQAEAAAPAEPSDSQPVPAEPTHGPSSEPDQAIAPAGRSPRSLAGKRFYTVRSGDCLTHIAEALLPARADDAQIAEKVARLYYLNEDRIGTGDPDLIYPGTVLDLR